MVGAAAAVVVAVELGAVGRKLKRPVWVFEDVNLTPTHTTNGMGCSRGLFGGIDDSGRSHETPDDVVGDAVDDRLH